VYEIKRERERKKEIEREKKERERERESEKITSNESKTVSENNRSYG